MHKLLLAASAALTLGLASCTAEESTTTDETNTESTTPKAAPVSFKVDGMT